MNTNDKKIIPCFLGACWMLVSSSCGNIEGGGAASGLDTQNPQVQISDPGNSAALFTAAGSYLVKASASDNVAIAKVEFYADGTLVSTDTLSPYEFTWSAIAAGSHTLRAKAFDTAGNTSEVSHQVTHTVDNTSPTVAITSPLNGGGNTGTNLNLSGSFSETNINKIEVYIGGVLRGNATLGAGTYTFTWSVAPPGGSKVILVRATDKAGNTGESQTLYTITDRAMCLVTCDADFAGDPAAIAQCKVACPTL